MAFLLLALLVAGLLTGAVYKNPAARAAAGGAWRQGSAQARVEAAKGWDAARSRYTAAQAHLAKPMRGADGKLYRPGPRNWQWWWSHALRVAAGTATAAGGAVWAGGHLALGAARIGREAVRGATEGYRRHRGTIDVESVKVLDGELVEDEAPRVCRDCPSTVVRHLDDLTPPDWYCHRCATLRRTQSTKPPVDLDGFDVPDPRADTTKERIIMSLESEANSLAALKGTLAGEIAELDQRVASIDSLMASLSGQGLDAGTINGLSSYQDNITGARSICSSLLAHVEAKHNQVAEAIQAAGGSGEVAQAAFYDEG